jgi:hypothetical protein
MLLSLIEVLQCITVLLCDVMELNREFTVYYSDEIIPSHLGEKE